MLAKFTRKFQANSQTVAATPRRSVQPAQNDENHVDPGSLKFFWIKKHTIISAVEKANHQVFHSLMSVQQSVEGKFATIQVIT